MGRWGDDDAVWFSGTACSFRIAAPDVVVPAYGNVPEGEGPGEYGFEIRHPTRQVTLEMTIIATEGRREWRDAQALAASIRLLRRSDTLVGERQYPPLTLRPGLLVTARQARRDGLMYGTVLVFCGLFLALRRSTEDFLIILGFPIMVFCWIREAGYQKAIAKIAADDDAAMPSP